MYWFQLPTLELVINTSLYIVLVHYTVEATSIKHGVWNQRILCQDVLLVFPLFSRSNFQGIVQLNAKLMNSCLNLPFVKLVLRIHIKLDTNPTQATFLWLSTNHCSNVPTYRKKKTIKVWRDTFWSDVMNYKNAPNILLLSRAERKCNKILTTQNLLPVLPLWFHWILSKKNEDKHVFFRT